jgi:molybdopterin synthase catalytic subunit
LFQVSIEAEAIDPAALLAQFSLDPQRTGAVATFTGYVRGEGISALALEHYPDMTERNILDTLHSAARRWPLQAASVLHRVGELGPGEPIVWVAVSSSHRAAAFNACEFIMDYLKISAPLWKRERDTAGVWRWVQPRLADRERAQRWGAGAPGKMEAGQGALL